MQSPHFHESEQSRLCPHFGQLTLQMFLGNSSPQFSHEGFSLPLAQQ